MPNSESEFNRVAKAKTGAPSPFCLRLSFEERAQLEGEAGSMALGAYIRDRLFGPFAVPRKRRGRQPVKDHEALGRVLAALGGSRLSSNLNQLARAVNSGSLPVTPETENDLKEACQAVVLLRGELMRALGVSPGGEP